MATLASGSRRAALPRASALAWWNAAFFALLCATETGFAAGAVDWALAGMLDLPVAVYGTLGAVLALGVLWLAVLAFRAALAAERRLGSGA